MQDWLTWLAIAVGIPIASWATLWLLAGQLPPGILKDPAAFIPDCVTTVRRLQSHSWPGEPTLIRRHIGPPRQPAETAPLEPRA